MAQDTPDSLQQSIDASDRLWSAGDSAWFDFLAEDATVYAVGSAEPFRGRDAYRAHYGRRLAEVRRDYSVLNREIQMLDETSAVVSQLLRLNEDQLVIHVRQSVVWRDGRGPNNAWGIEHLHSAIVGPAAPEAAALTESVGVIQVLNEKIATIATVLGVAQ